MKTFKKTLLSMGIALATVSGQASAGYFDFTDWGFDPSGGGVYAGVGGLRTPIDEMSYNGTSFTDSTGNPQVAGSTFTDKGYFSASGFLNEGTPINPPSGLGFLYEITATFLNWSGSYGTTVGDNTPYSFNPGGTINLFIDGTPYGGAIDGFTGFAGAGNGINILTLSIIAGNGNTNLNDITVDGNVNILFAVTAAAAGFWFVDMDNDGFAETDVSTLLGADPLTIAVTDSNNHIYTPGSTVQTDFGNPAINPAAGDFYTTQNGSATIGSIPEPGTLALLGLGFLGLSKATRRKA